MVDEGLCYVEFGFVVGFDGFGVVLVCGWWNVCVEKDYDLCFFYWVNDFLVDF